MKATSNQQATIHRLMDETLTSQGIHRVVNHFHQVKPTKCRFKRVRWDLFYLIPQAERFTLIDDLYESGMKDSHIDTVLRQWWANHPQLSALKDA